MDIVSRTAVWVAASRAIGARDPDPDVRNPDYLAERLLGDISGYDVDVPLVHALEDSYDAAMSDLEIAGHVRAMMVRTRFIDDALERAVDEGASQVLILGAGFDSHAYRFAESLRRVRIFEVDRPAMLAYKRQRVEQVLGSVPDNVSFVQLDVQQENLRELLAAQGYDFGQRSFIIMEGLTMYLREASLRDLLSLVATHRAGSSAVFDFVSDAMIAAIRNIRIEEVPEIGRAFVQRFLHLIRDEPWDFGFPLGQEREFIESFGFDIHDLIILDSDEAVRRYLTRADGTQVAEATMALRPKLPPEMERAQREQMAYRICEAVVAQRH